MRCGRWIPLLLAWPTVAAPAQLVINEIEYDQTGTDVRDFVELVEPARSGMSLVGWQLILYDGTPSQRCPYLTIDLSTAPGGVMPTDGYLVIGPAGTTVPNVDVTAPTGGWIQNGGAAPDGMALVHGGLVVELLAYEGSFVGDPVNGGPAAGMTFPDLGIVDSGSDEGLQRIPDGGPWTVLPEAAATPGLPNPAHWDVVAHGKLTLMQQTDAVSGAIPLCAGGGTPPYAFNVVALPAHGVLHHGGGAITQVPTTVAGSLTYVPAAGFSGLDTFDFTAVDNAGHVSPVATQEIGVQFGLNGVIVAEVMSAPLGDPRAGEYVEIYNAGPLPVSLGRLDTSFPLSANTLDNLAGWTIPPGQARIIAPDARTEGIGLEGFRCAWGLLESEIVRVPFANWELLFSAPLAGLCSLSDGSRLLLFDAQGRLLDGVDLRDPDLPTTISGQALTIDAAALVPSGAPLDTRNNDTAASWVRAGTPAVSGVRLSLQGEFGGPMFVPTWSTTPYVPTACTGRCCLPEGQCALLSYAACDASGGELSTWAPGARCRVDLVDYRAFRDCCAGPGSAPPPGCATQDSDADGDIDLADFVTFQLAFGTAPCP